VTGDASGIEFRMATAHAKRGAQVVVAHIDSARAKADADKLQEQGRVRPGAELDMTEDLRPRPWRSYR
jgi:NAD(P)-dependent dehydrogenase (short-subunit alcohol dehydrogenase family)